MGLIYCNYDKVVLKPCPFCGGAVKLNFHFVPTLDGDEYNEYYIGCAACGIYLYQLWEYDKIVEKWNTRYVEGENINDTRRKN